MSYIVTEVYRGTNPGYGDGPPVNAPSGATDDPNASEPDHEVLGAPETRGL